MSRITLKSQAIIIDQLTSDLAEANTTKGILMSEIAALKAELAKAETSAQSLRETCDKYESIIAGQPSSPKPSAPRNPKPAPKPSVPAQVIASPAAQEAMAMFLKLTPAQRSAVVKHSGFKCVNLSNILECQAKWHSRKSA